MVHLRQDLAFISTNHQRLAIAHALHNPTADEERYRVTALALWSVLVDHCRAITLLLQEGLVYSARALNRTAYETSIHLLYLANFGNKHENARLYETRMFYELIATLPPGFTVETRKLLDDVPPEIRERVEKDRNSRKKRGLQWSGKTLSQMATDLRIRQHKAIFALLSWPTHGLNAGEDMLRIDGGPDEGVTFWRQDVDTEDINVIARHTRRTVLRPAYYLATVDFYGNPVPELPTPKPPHGY